MFKISVKPLNIYNFVDFAWKLYILPHMISCFQYKLRFLQPIFFQCVNQRALALTNEVPRCYLIVMHVFSNETYFLASVLAIIIIFWLYIHALFLGFDCLLNYLFLKIYWIPRVFVLFFAYLWELVFVGWNGVERQIGHVLFLEDHHWGLAADWW